MSEDDVVRAKVTIPGGAGGEVAVGKSFGDFLAKVFPGRTIKGQARVTIASDIFAKHRAGSPLADAEIEYLERVFAGPEAKLVKQQQIAARALELSRTSPQLNSIPNDPFPSGAMPPDAEKPPEVDEDWLSRFWDDAGLVSAAMLQELYARLLVSEANAPGSCSLRTLRVLRYLDKETAEHFRDLMKWVFGGLWVPRSSPPVDHDFDIPYGLILSLDDAGLIDSGPSIARTHTKDEEFIWYGSLILRMQKCRGLVLPTYPLTLAGRELARVAQITREKEMFFRMARWVQMNKGDMTCTWAETPTDNWEGTASQLVWYPVPPAAPS